MAFETLAPIIHGIPCTDSLVSNNSTIYTNSFVLTRKRFFGAEVKFISDTDVNVQVDLEQSNQREEVQGSYSANFIKAINTLETITDEKVHLLPVAPVVAVYARLKLTGLYSGTASNSVTTVLDRANWCEVEA